jgi:type I restriction enzyme S subunit
MTALPAGWTRSTLGDVAVWGSGGTPTAGRSDFYGGDIPWAVIGDLNDDLVVKTARSLTVSGLQNSSAKVVPAQTVLVGMYGSIGKLGVAAAPLSTNQAIATARTHPYLLPRFLFYFLLSERRALVRAGKGAAQKNISQAVLRPWPITFPSLVEQARIVDLLDDHFSRLTAADAYLKASLTRLSRMRLARLREIRRGLREAGTPMRMLGSVTETTLGKMLDSKKVAGEGTPYLRNINVRWGGFDLSDVKSVQLRVDERDRFALSAGDILVCEGGEPGRCAVWPGSDELMAFQKALHRVRVDTALLDPYFVAAMLEMAIAEPGAEQMFTGTTIRHLPQERLRQIEIHVPSLEDQERTAADLTDLGSQVCRLHDAMVALQNRSAGLRRGLLEAAFTGRLTGKSLDMEIAEELADSRGAMA